MRLVLAIMIVFICCTTLSSQTLHKTPPFSGTIFIDPDIITSSDSSAFQSVTYTGQGSRMMFDRRVNNWITVNAFLFNALFLDGLSAEIQVNPEFSTSALALVEAQKYGPIIGRLPTTLRSSMQTVWIHKGTQPFGGGNKNILIHTGQSTSYEDDGILEETLVHEAAHTSLDAAHAASTGWLAAQTADNEFISTYARDNPTREDVAESFLTYLAVKYRPDRITANLAQIITSTIPNRIAYFEKQPFVMYPILKPTTGIRGSVSNTVPESFTIMQNYPNPFNPSTTIRYGLPIQGKVSLNVYNVLGQAVAKLIDGEQQAGWHETQWNADVPSGLYFYRIDVVNNTNPGQRISQIRKMMLLK